MERKTVLGRPESRLTLRCRSHPGRPSISWEGELRNHRWGWLCPVRSARGMVWKGASAPWGDPSQRKRRSRWVLRGESLGIRWESRRRMVPAEGRKIQRLGTILMLGGAGWVWGWLQVVSQGGPCGGRLGGSEMRPAGSRLSGPGGGAKECGVYLCGHKGATEGLSVGP